jgi:predicted RND superfamily exporter protein
MRFRLPSDVRKRVISKGEDAFTGIAATILRFRLPIGLLLIGITLFMIYGVTKVRIATSFVDFFPRKHPNVKLYEEYQPVFGGAQSLTIAIRVRSGDIFNFDTLQKIQNVNEAVDALPGVNHLSLRSLASYRVSYVEPVPGGLQAKTFMYPDIPKNEAELRELKHEVLAHKDILASLVSSDYRTAVIIATFNEQVLEYRELFQQVQKIVRSNTDNSHVVYVGGEPIIRGFGYHYLPVISICFVAAIVTMIFLLYMSLGHRTRWWAPIVTGTLSAMWGLGFVGWMGYDFDPVMLVIPFVLTARDLSHGIQWQGRYYNELDACREKYEAIVATTNYMLPPGFLSIIADIAGIIFVSLGGIPVLQHIGFAGAVWLASSLTMVFVFEPIFLSFSPVPGIRGRSFGEHAWVDWVPGGMKRALERFVQIPVTPGRLRGVLLIVAGLFLVWGIAAGERAKIGYSTPGTPLYRSNSKVNQDLIAISKDFPLDESWAVLSSPPYPDNNNTLSPLTVKMVDDLRAFLLRDSNVIDVISYASSILEDSNQMFHNGYPKYRATTDSYRLGENLWWLYFGGTAPGEADRYITDYKRTACIRILLRDHTFDTLNRVRNELAAFEKNRISSDPLLRRVHLSYLGGLGGLYAAANDVLFRLDIINITFVLTVVLVFSALSFRSVIAGLLFVLSCVLANFAAFIYMGLRGIGLTIDTVPVISLGIGLGVDYGIYIVARIRDEVARGRPLEEAITIAITATGAAVFSTFSVMVGGILPWVFSPLLFHNQMAVLLTFLMATNMIAGILILPAYIARFRPKFISRLEAEHEAPMAALTGAAEVR